MNKGELKDETLVQNKNMNRIKVIKRLKCSVETERLPEPFFGFLLNRLNYAKYSSMKIILFQRYTYIIVFYYFCIGYKIY